jgi:cell division protein FtsI/penicillin-binding protein 2
MTRPRTVAIAVVVALVAGAAGAGWFFLRDDEPALPGREVAAYLAAWERFDVAGMRALIAAPPPELEAAVTGMQADLQVTTARFAPGLVRRQGDVVIADFNAELTLGGLGVWSYPGTLQLARTAGKWLVQWSPAALHPDLAPGQTFDRTRSWPARAPILGADGSPLVTAGDVVLVGLEPDRITDRALVDAVLKQHLGVDPATTTAALRAPGVKPDHFVQVARVRADGFAALRPVLEPVPGIFFQRTTARLAVSENFAAHVLGRFDEVTAERLTELGEPYAVGDNVGLSGLEGNFERQLAGAPSGEVRTVDAGGATVRTLFRFPGTPPQPVRTTLDRRTQEAAEAALAGVTAPAAIVAVDAATGDVRAVVSRPLDQPFNRALAGQYPPASTFKVVTTAALLAGGTRPETPVACPAEATVGGQTFRNFEGGSLGGTTFRSAFAQSCNTAFVTLSANLADAAMAAAATSFGFGAKYDLGVPTAGAAFPNPKDAAEKASEAIGQGRVEASPVHMATVAAAVASGSWRAPRLLSDTPASAPVALDPQVAATLKDLTAEVVRTGTGTRAAVSGQQVAGKTGTAETTDPAKTHAWFIGYRGSLAFSVLVEGGGVGGQVAAPLAARFLTAAP